MHGQLGKADVHRIHGDVGGADIAQRGPAEQIGAVRVMLHRHARPAADLRKDRLAHRVGGVLLVGVVLDDDTAVDHGAILAVGVLGVIGMHRVGVVRRDHEAGRDTAVEVPPERLADAPKRVRQKVRVGALLGGAAHLLVVKEAEQRGVSPGLRREEALKAAEGALQVVQPGGGDVLLVRTEADAGCAGIEIEIGGDQILRPDTRGFGGDGLHASRGLLAAEQGQHVDFDVVLSAVVGRAVHVNGQIRDQREIALNVDKPRDELSALAHRDPAGHGQRPVQPGSAEHGAVALHTQTGIYARGGGIGLAAQLEQRRVQVRGHHQKAGELALRHTEGDHARAVAADKVLSAGTELPSLGLAQLTVSGLVQTGDKIGTGVPGGGACVDKTQQLPIGFGHFFSFAAPAYRRAGEAPVRELRPAAIS